MRPAGSTRFQFGWPGVLAHPFNAIKDAEQKAAAGASPEQLVPGMTEGALATMGAGSPFARPAGSLGTFIGRRQADRLADAGRPAARQAIDLADMLEQMGTSPEEIRTAVHDVLKDDPSLGTIWKPHPDEDWRVEISDAGTKVRQPGPGVPSASTLGQENDASRPIPRRAVA